MSVLVVGVGHPDRGDDGVGPWVVEEVGRQAPDDVEVACVRGDLFAMLERWQGRDTVLVVDAMRSGAAPGSVRRFQVDRDGLDAGASFASTHSVDLAQAVELARSLGRMPGQLVIYGVEAAGVDLGAGLSAPVAHAARALVRQILEECACTRHP